VTGYFLNARCFDWWLGRGGLFADMSIHDSPDVGDSNHL
jgi:hypothetical protein